MKKETCKVVTLMTGCIFAALFVLLIFSAANIDPTNTEWVTGGGGDNLQHYLGWRFFRESRWTRYLLFMRNLNYPVGTSVIVTDSNPLLSLIFKLFSGVLPQQFQFNGIWILCSYVLTALFAGLVGWRLTHHSLLTLCGTILSLLNPAILQRALVHDTLTAHWLILAAIFLFLNDDKRWNLFAWVVLTEVTLLIHIYFLPMIAFIFALQLIRMIVRKNSFRRMLLLIIAFSASLFVGYYCWGYAFILPQSGSFGELSMNLNAFFNPDGTSKMIGSRSTLPLQYEGFNYWGVGVLVLAAAGIMMCGWHKGKKLIPYIIPTVLLILIAASNVGYFDLYRVYQIKLSDQLLSLLSIFRSSGRLAWPVYYLVLFFCLWIMASSSWKRWMRLLIPTVCVLLQLYDLSGFISESAGRFRNPGNELAEIPPEFESLLPESVKSLFVSDGEGKEQDALALFAIDHHLTYNHIANARTIQKVFGGDELDMSELRCDLVDPVSAYLYLSHDYPERLHECAGLQIVPIGSWTLIYRTEQK